MHPHPSRRENVSSGRRSESVSPIGGPTMLHSALLTSLDRLLRSRSKRRPQPAASSRSRTGTRPTLELLEDRLALSGYTFANIDVPNSDGTGVHGINDHGQLVGDYGNANGEHGFLLSGGQYKK